MKANSLKAYLHARKLLETEKHQLEQQLSRINSALNGHARTEPPVPVRTVPASPVKLNKVGLKTLCTTLLKQKSLSKPDLLKAVLASGYQFSTAKPLGSLNAMLYSNSQFKVKDDKWTVR